MRSGASRQTYIGNVIFPANFIEKGERRMFNFTLFVDGVAQAKGVKERRSAKISCTYTLPSGKDFDEVGVILSRVSSKDEETPSKGLNGHNYKRVSVLVEGDERLMEVEGKPSAYYKNLDNCRVIVLDRNLTYHYSQEFGRDGERVQESTGESEGNAGTTSDRPNVAPETKKTTHKTYQVGEVVKHGDKSYRFKGGDVSVLDSWEEVLEDQETPELPFGKSPEAAPKKEVVSSTKKMSSPIADLLNEDDDDPDSPNFKRDSFAA